MHALGMLYERSGNWPFALDMLDKEAQAAGATPEAVELKLLQVVPEEFRRHAHHWLILHGRYVCLARKPGCPQCAIRDLCGYREKTRA